MLKLKTPNLSPPGGLSYTQPETGMEFHDFAIKAVKRKVHDHRMSLPKELMDVSPGWEERLEHDICQQNPRATCVERKDKVQNAERSLLIRAKSFLAAVWNLKMSGAKMVDQAEQERRAAICRGCPFKTDIQSACGPCTNLVGWTMQVLGGKKLVEIEGACGVCGCGLEAKLAFPLDVLRKADGRTVDYPTFCWMVE